jgi:hypothetical protein
MLKITDPRELLNLALKKPSNSECTTCNMLMNPGWESVPGSFDLALLQLIGTLRVEDQPEVWDEYHPHGTHSWSADAPIAIGYHPYNRCDIYQCVDCSRKYLRYGEYGGYYVDERIRPLNPKFIVISQ